MRFLTSILAMVLLVTGLRAQTVISVPAQYPTLGEALAAAPEGATIRVAAGTYEENLRIAKSVKLIGAGRDDVVLRGDPGSPVVAILEGKVTVTGITVECPPTKEPTGKSPVVSIEAGGVTVSDCRVQGGHGHGILVTGAKEVALEGLEIISNHGCGFQLEKAEVRIRSCRAILNKLDGIKVDATTCTMTETTFEANQGRGAIIQGEGAKAELVKVVCKGNGNAGMILLGGAKGKIRECSALQNKRSGLEALEPETTVEITGGEYSGNLRVGIYVGKGARCRVVKARCCDNETDGIVVRDRGSTAELEENECHRNKKTGIAVYDGGYGLARANVCKDNLESGIIAYRKGARGHFVKNRCENNGKHGIAFSLEATGKALDNHVQGNKQGLGVYQKASATFERNTSLANDCDGILIYNGGRGVLRRNTCDQNGNSGIALRGPGSEALIERNRCRDNAHFGVGYGNGAERPTVGPGNILKKNKRGKIQR